MTAADYCQILPLPPSPLKKAQYVIKKKRAIRGETIFRQRFNFCLKIIRSFFIIFFKSLHFLVTIIVFFYWDGSITGGLQITCKLWFTGECILYVYRFDINAGSKISLSLVQVLKSTCLFYQLLFHKVIMEVIKKNIQQILFCDINKEYSAMENARNIKALHQVQTTGVKLVVNRVANFRNPW